MHGLRWKPGRFLELVGRAREASGGGWSCAGGFWRWSGLCGLIRKLEEAFGEAQEDMRAAGRFVILDGGSEQEEQFQRESAVRVEKPDGPIEIRVRWRRHHGGPTSSNNNGEWPAARRRT